MNQDVLFVVATFTDCKTLAAICRVSQAIRPIATRRLYRTVRLRSLHEVYGLRDAFARDLELPTRVLGFFCHSAFCVRPKPRGARAREKAISAWIAQLQALLDILPLLTSLQDFALDCTEMHGLFRDSLAHRLATLPRLRGVQLPGIGSMNLCLLRAAHMPLNHVAFSEEDHFGLVSWLPSHAATLQTLRIDRCSNLITQLADSPNTPVFPQLHTLEVSGETYCPSENWVRLFPSLRSLSMYRSVTMVSVLWPSLEHLDIHMDPSQYFPSGMAPYGPAVCSLKLRHCGMELDGPARMEFWALPQIRALELPPVAFATHAAALKAFTGLRLLDLSLFGNINNTDAASWLRKAAALPIVPPHWEILTLRGATGLDQVSGDTMSAMRKSFPSLRLLRIVAEAPPQRLVFAYPRPLDWVTSCEIVADYLPHLRDIRAPWDDIETSDT